MYISFYRKLDRASFRFAISAACIAKAISSSSWHSELYEDVSLEALQLYFQLNKVNQLKKNLYSHLSELGVIEL